MSTARRPATPRAGSLSPGSPGGAPRSPRRRRASVITARDASRAARRVRRGSRCSPRYPVEPSPVPQLVGREEAPALGGRARLGHPVLNLVAPPQVVGHLLMALEIRRRAVDLVEEE